MTEENLPDTIDGPPAQPPFLDDIDTHIVEITMHDRQDIVIGRQYYVLFLEDATEGRYVLSNVSSPVTTETAQL